MYFILPVYDFCFNFYSRPKTVDDVAYQDEVVAVLKSSLKSHDVMSCNKSI